MEDYFKNRPVITAPEGVAPFSAGAGAGSGSSPFANLRREPKATPSSSPANPSASGSTAAAAAASANVQSPGTHTETGEHGTKVETIVERGRVTKIIVTCSCGKKTELDCSY
jgi:hypothetical protein